MASIRKRSEGQWEVRVRRRGYPLACQTFATKRDAEAWAAVTESEMVRGVFVDRSEAERTSLKEVLVRYELEILPRKKESTRYKEGYIARMWQRQDLAVRAIARIRPADLVQWREGRLKQVGPKTCRNELLLLRHVFEMATKEFSIESLEQFPLSRNRGGFPRVAKSDSR